MLYKSLASLLCVCWSQSVGQPNFCFGWGCPLPFPFSSPFCYLLITVPFHGPYPLNPASGLQEAVFSYSYSYCRLIFLLCILCILLSIFLCTLIQLPYQINHLRISLPHRVTSEHNHQTVSGAFEVKITHLLAVASNSFCNQITYTYTCRDEQ